MYQRRLYEPDDGGWIAWLSITFLAVVAFLFYVVSVLATHLFLHYVVNPHLVEYKLDEDDNLVLLWSALVWAIWGPLVMVSIVLEEGLPSLDQGLAILVWLLILAVGFGGYGLLVGFGLVWWLWDSYLKSSESGLQLVDMMGTSTPTSLPAEPVVVSSNGTEQEPLTVLPEWLKEGVVFGEDV